MQTPKHENLPELDEWLEHIDTVVLGREEGSDVDPPVEDESTEGRGAHSVGSGLR